MASSRSPERLAAMLKAQQPGPPTFSPMRLALIPRFSDHAANERTFLAWVRTGIATIAFGYVIDKFNLFMLTLTDANAAIGSEHHFSGKLSGALGRYDGTALIFIGIALILVAVARFIRMGRLIDDEATHSASSVRTELILSLVLVIAALASYIAFH
jgi:putative membrane protein